MSAYNKVKLAIQDLEDRVDRDKLEGLNDFDAKSIAEGDKKTHCGEKMQCPRCAEEGKDKHKDNLLIYKYIDTGEYSNSYCIVRHHHDWESGSVVREEFDVVDVEKEKNVVKKKSSIISLSTQLGNIPWRHIDFYKNGNVKKVYGSMENSQILLSTYGVAMKYNPMSKETQINIPDKKFPIESSQASALTLIRSLAIINGLPTENLEDYLDVIAYENAYNPAVDWVSSKKWDGVDRIHLLTATLNPTKPELAYLLLRRWLISAVGVIFTEGVAPQGVLVLQGEQNMRKTTWIEELVGGHKDWVKLGAMLNPSDKDSVMQVVKYWVVELGELDSTFRKSDIGRLKAFLTNNEDELRTPYARKAKKYPRRTVFAASVNETSFLHDATGNRRFWVIACEGQIQTRNGIDMQQVYAQAKSLLDEGEQINLTDDEIDRLNDSNEDHESMSGMEERIRETYFFERINGGEYTTKMMSSSEILINLGYKTPTRAETTECGLILSKKLKVVQKRSNRVRKYSIPILIEEKSSIFDE